ncbi:MAG: phosphoribosylanthranilate isomerase, partial [Gammaproteobacteria bacterium]|nr:phosphoribosylanthranilate isomerase [Gammaproteobacteria bacterium]
PADVERVLDAVPLELVQFNGQEDAVACGRFGLPYLKAVGVRAGFCMEALEDAHPAARGFLLDAYDPVARGGTGRTFDWSLWPTSARRPLVLAGGLTPDNVGAAIRRLQPYGVDVASGVEGGARGVKSDAKVRAFVAEVQRAALQ